MSAFLRGVGLLLLALLGILTGLAGLFVSRMNADVLGAGLPFGLVLGIAAAGMLLGQGRRLLGVPGVLAASVGWAIPVVAALWPRPEGDIVLAGDWYGLGFVLFGVIVAAWQLIRAMASSPD
ncbi:DUF6113 family protein [Actinopolymorpha alba]|uniref:DUF6113 family protein n=1 Tax=Actinopolymorpha alba TaxID=533267 RepID=UPI00036627A6|nr:DUF6113 family protein [Actinopolymorpha alba]